MKDRNIKVEGRSPIVSVLKYKPFNSTNVLSRSSNLILVLSFQKHHIWQDGIILHTTSNWGLPTALSSMRRGLPNGIKIRTWNLIVLCKRNINITHAYPLDIFFAMISKIQLVKGKKTDETRQKRKALQSLSKQKDPKHCKIQLAYEQLLKEING